MTQTVRRLGFANAAMLYTSRLMRRVSRGRARIQRYHFVAQPVPSAPQRTKSGAVTVVEVRPDDPIVGQFPRHPKVIARRFANGGTCLVAHEAGRFAGYLWLQFGPYDEDEVRCRYLLEPADRTAWDFDVYVDPAYRMGRTFARLWEAANDRMRERGVEWSLSRISAFNRQSLRAHQRFGVRHLRTVTFVRLGRLQLMLMAGKPWLHVSFGPHSRPTLTLRAPASRPQGAG